MVPREMVTNLLPSTPSWKGLKSSSLDPLALQPLQLMLKTRLLISRSCLRCWDVLTSFKLGWLAISLRQKSEREHHTIHQREDELTAEFMKRFLRLAGFVGKKAGPPKEQAKHFKLKNNQEKDKIRSKPDKNRKRGEAEKSLKQLQWIKQEKPNKT
nr:zinc finger, CCHC-type, retrotransposon Gag domain protein [Tanacetum cinerariifolium]GFB23498.1 zinc finger, CCHC-type, retrotransposon Gag domain protein [Tanacetum cinerariifolium]